MPVTQPSSTHAQHDALLIAQLAANDTTPSERRAGNRARGRVPGVRGPPPRPRGTHRRHAGDARSGSAARLPVDRGRRRPTQPPRLAQLAGATCRTAVRLGAAGRRRFGGARGRGPDLRIAPGGGPLQQQRVGARCRSSRHRSRAGRGHQLRRIQRGRSREVGPHRVVRSQQCRRAAVPPHRPQRRRRPRSPPPTAAPITAGTVPAPAASSAQAGHQRDGKARAAAPDAAPRASARRDGVNPAASAPGRRPGPRTRSRRPSRPPRRRPRSTPRPCPRRPAPRPRSRRGSRRPPAEAGNGPNRAADSSPARPGVDRPGRSSVSACSSLVGRRFR